MDMSLRAMAEEEPSNLFKISHPASILAVLDGVP